MDPLNSEYLVCISTCEMEAVTMKMRKQVSNPESTTETFPVRTETCPTTMSLLPKNNTPRKNTNVQRGTTQTPGNKIPPKASQGLVLGLGGGGKSTTCFLALVLRSVQAPWPPSTMARRQFSWDQFYTASTHCRGAEDVQTKIIAHWAVHTGISRSNFWFLNDHVGVNSFN